MTVQCCGRAVRDPEQKSIIVFADSRYTKFSTLLQVT
ncbi:MAG: hypothetical protein DRN15_11270 [Thermoprotei archaeon]|nr:MAG: hypothetical protein DRN15_11270 [Thermoprotei archaeon]